MPAQFIHECSQHGNSRHLTLWTSEIKQETLFTFNLWNHHPFGHLGHHFMSDLSESQADTLGSKSIRYSCYPGGGFLWKHKKITSKNLICFFPIKLYIEKRLNILVIREKQMTTTMEYHFTPARMAVHREGRTITEEENVEMLEPSHIAGGCSKVQPLCKTIWLLLEKLHIKYDPTIPS